MVRHDDSLGFNGGFDVVDAEDVGAFQEADGVEHGGAVQCLGRASSQEFVNHGFSGDANQQRHVQFFEVFEVVQEFVVV